MAYEYLRNRNYSGDKEIKSIAKKIEHSLKKFDLNLNNKIVLTEAATGNYVVTPIIAAMGGARVFAYTKASVYGSIDEVKKQTNRLAEELMVKERISIIEDFNDINLQDIDVLTNTGFLRPINEALIKKLSSKCVIPLMYEPWELRKDELDIEACYKYGIKVYGTNEDDERLKTKEYIGFTVLSLLLENKLSPYSANVLLLGCENFADPVEKILKQNRYDVVKVTDYTLSLPILNFKAIVILEHERDTMIIGDNNAFIKKDEINEDTFVVHICGNVSLDDARFRYIPEKPRPFGYMSFTADYVDSQAVIDLHTAGLKVAEGMLEAKKLGLEAYEYKMFMEKKYPALAFPEPKFW